jgi:hypothetical protein
VSRPQITLSDLYRDCPLTEAQARRIVALLGLAQLRHKTDDAKVPASTPSREIAHQQAS